MAQAAATADFASYAAQRFPPQPLPTGAGANVGPAVVGTVAVEVASPGGRLRLGDEWVEPSVVRSPVVQPAMVRLPFFVSFLIY